ncbi:MAG: aldose epimerase family protein [bacterium]|nr:aldose epimerase family protein [bacterium]
MSIKQEAFGMTKDNQEVTIYKIMNNKGMEAHVINEGAALMSLIVPDKNNIKEDVVLGFEDLKSYEINGPSFGATIGRNANRIKDAKVVIEGVTYELDKNDGNNNLHGGKEGYGRVYYTASVKEEAGQDTVTFHRVSPNMEQGFPGTFTYQVSYTVTDDNELIIRYEGISDQTTIVNMTNHSYFNLKGHKSGSAMDHKLRIHASKITESDEESICDGSYLEVAGTPMDFREYKVIGKDIEADYKPLKDASGYDHNYVLENGGDLTVKVADLVDETSGRHMEVYTDAKGMQLYTANFLVPEEGCTFKEHASYPVRGAVCLETQAFPNACNIPSFPSTILQADEKYQTTTIYKFV